MLTLKNLVPQSIRNGIHLLQALLANIVYGFPASSLKIIAVTGTDGKTTTSAMIYRILREAGLEVGLISSVSAKFGGKEMDTGFHVTTPDPWDVPKYLRMMVNSGVKCVVLEVTSQALDQNRLGRIAIEKAVFTNITHDHLDYHKTWKAYARAKTRLIDFLNDGGEVIYKTDELGAKAIENKIRLSPKVLLVTSTNDTLIKDKKVSTEGLTFLYDIKGKSCEIFIPILGEYNISNAQCAIKACESLATREQIISALRAFLSVKGRMNIVERNRPCLVIVDFAHTPNGLKNVLSTVKNLTSKGRVTAVFGCAGLRDAAKRPRMGKIAARLADIVIITSEDPRIENLTKINSKILEGALARKGVLVERFADSKAYRLSSTLKLSEEVKKILVLKKTAVFVFDESSPKSREDAIDLAIKIAEDSDTVITLGKGHEQSLCFGTTEYPWSDFNAVKKAIAERYETKNN